jgi:photoactive yellow protein
LTGIRLPEFDHPELATEVDQLSEPLIDTLPFGAVRLDAQGAVLVFNETERLASGSKMQARMGLDFFRQVAPCFGRPEYKGMIEQALKRGTVDLEFTHVGDFDDPDREMTVRVQSSRHGGYWIFMRRDT